MHLRLFSKNGSTREGKRHVTTALAKLILAKNLKNQSHPCTKFAINALGECFHSQDDEAKVLIGLKAALKQAPSLMDIEYKVTLPNHDYVIAPLHKLIPSFIGDICI